MRELSISEQLRDVCYAMAQGDNSAETVRKYLHLLGKDATDETVQKELEEMFGSE